METLKFKTNIKCDACVAKVTPALNKTVGEGNWKVDMQDPQRTLTISKDQVKADEVITALQEVGYTAEK